MIEYARVTTSESHIWIRFERIGQGSKFDLLLDAFRSAFPLADWDKSHRAWRLSAEQLDRVVKFCNRTLGPGCIKFQEYDTTIFTIRQLSIF